MDIREVWKIKDIRRCPTPTTPMSMPPSPPNAPVCREVERKMVVMASGKVKTPRDVQAAASTRAQRGPERRRCR